MKKLAHLTIAAALALTACGSDSGGSGPLSGAFCADLEAGLTPFQILQPTINDGTNTPQEAADLAYGMASVSCPEQLKSNEGLRTYLGNWNINPDA